MIELLAFSLDGARYALPLERVREVARRVHITELPAAPAIVLGLIVHRGQAIPAIDLRARLGRTEKAPSLADHLVIADGPRRRVALVVDAVIGPCSVDPDAVIPPTVSDPHVRGVVVVGGGLLLVEDLDALLSLDEEDVLTRALEAR